MHLTRSLRALAMLGITAAFLASPVVHSETPAEAEALAGRMLDALGGRAAWAGLRNTINGW